MSKEPKTSPPPYHSTPNQLPQPLQITTTRCSTNHPNNINPTENNNFEPKYRYPFSRISHTTAPHNAKPSLSSPTPKTLEIKPQENTLKPNSIQQNWMANQNPKSEAPRSEHYSTTCTNLENPHCFAKFATPHELGVPKRSLSRTKLERNN